MQNINNQVNWQIWYTSSNDRALDFIKNFKSNYKELKDKADFTPRFVTWSCVGCDSEFKKKECLSGGKYCAMNHQGGYVEGKDILMEDLREYCLHKLSKEDGKPEDWWNYMQYVHSMCYEEINEECSKLGHKNIGRDY